MKNLSRRTRLLLASLGAAAVLAAVTMLAVSSVHRQDQAAPGLNPTAFTLAPTVPSLAAADSDTVVMAPNSGAWWKKIAAMAPEPTGLLPLDPAKAGAPVLRLGYSRGPDHAKHDVPNTGPLRLVYLEAATAGDADTIAKWLKTEARYDSRRVYVQDRTVIVGQSWDSAFTVPEKTMQTVGAYQPGNATAQGSMWMNIDQEVVSLAGGPDTKAGKVYSTVFSKGMGFKPGTTWTGFSDSGDTWKGEFRSGGVDKNQISIDDTKEAVTGTEKVLFESKSGNATTKLIDQGAGALMAGASISAAGATMGAPIGDIPKVDDQIVSAVNDVTTWNSAATGNYSGPESVMQRTLSASATSMLIGLTYRPPGQDPSASAGRPLFGTGTNQHTK